MSIQYLPIKNLTKASSEADDFIRLTVYAEYLSAHYIKFQCSKKELREKFFQNLSKMLCGAKYFSV